MKFFKTIVITLLIFNLNLWGQTPIRLKIKDAWSDVTPEELTFIFRSEKFLEAGEYILELPKVSAYVNESNFKVISTDNLSINDIKIENGAVNLKVTAKKSTNSIIMYSFSLAYGGLVPKFEASLNSKTKTLDIRTYDNLKNVSLIGNYNSSQNFPLIKSLYYLNYKNVKRCNPNFVHEEEIEYRLCDPATWVLQEKDDYFETDNLFYVLFLDGKLQTENISDYIFRKEYKDLYVHTCFTSKKDSTIFGRFAKYPSYFLFSSETISKWKYNLTSSIPCQISYIGIPSKDITASKIVSIKNDKNLNLDTSANITLKEKNKSTIYGANLFTDSLTNRINFIFGLEPKILLDKKAIKEYTSRNAEGLKKTDNFAWEISAKNNCSERIFIRIYDQIPISSDSTIHISSLEISGATLDIKTGILFWDIELAPNESKEFIVKYVLIYPSDIKLVREEY